MKRISLAVIFLLAFYTPTALISPPPLNEPYDVYCGKGNIFSKSFTDPFEILYMVCYNGDVLYLTTRTQNAIYVDAYYTREFLKENGKELKDVCIMIHNHFVRPGLSYANSINLKALRRMGYKGSFCIYITTTKKIVCDGPIDNQGKNP